MLTKFQFHCSITCRNILYFVFWLPYCHTLWHHQYLICIIQKLRISLERYEIWQKGKYHSSSLLKELQIHLFFNTSIFHFIGTLNVVFDSKDGHITVFGFILTGRQNGQKLQCLYGNLMTANFFQNLNFTQFMNRNVKILTRRIKIVYTKLECRLDRRRSVNLSVVSFHARASSTLPNLQTILLKIRKINWARSSQASSIKLGE